MLTVTIDGTDVSGAAQVITSRHILGSPYIANVTFPIDYALTDLAGLLLKVEDDDLAVPLDHHGRILNVSDNDDENSGTTVITSYGGDEIWQWRPARDGAASDTPGNFSKPTFITRNGTGPQIMEEILTQSADGTDQATGEGDMMLELGAFAAGGADLSGAPVDWPMMIAAVRALLQNTGELDVIVTPIDTGGNIGRVDCYNGNFGSDLSATVLFEYATGLNNVRLIRRTIDYSRAMNKLWYYLGPKYDDQHWQSNLTGTDERAEVDGGPPGGVAPGTDAGPPMSDVLALRAASQAAILVRMQISVYDALQAEGFAKPLWWRLWLTEQTTRAFGRTMVHVTPERGILPTFDIGDIVGVGAGAVFRGGVATAGQRIYERELTWDADGVVALSELVTSADGDAA